MAAKCLPVFSESAEAVSHRMGVFAEDQRTRFIRHADPLLNRPFRHGRERLIPIDAGVHRADDIGGGAICPAAFVLHRTRRIGGFQPAVERIVIRAVPGLIPQRPDNDRRMVAVAQHHAGNALAHGGQPAGIVRKAAHWNHAVRFDIGFIDNVQPVAIAKGVPQGMVRVVRAADGVKVVLLHQFDVATHGCFVHHLTVFRVMLMAVHPRMSRVYR